MKKRKITLNGLLQNNNVLLIISLIVSIALWIYMSLGSSNDTNRIISNIPIQIELSEDARSSGLQIFYTNESTASVTVTGNRSILGSISESDINVTASANTINSYGNFSLNVSASKANPSSNFQITSAADPSTINVLADYFRESSFQIQDNIVYKVKDGYYASTSLASEAVIISGPQTEISKIDKVSAVCEINGTLSETTSVKASIVLYDEDGKSIDSKFLTLEMTEVEATVTVLPEKTVEIKPVFVNKPDGLELTDDMLTIEPSTILLAGKQSVLDDVPYVELDSIDFSELDNTKKVFDSLAINIPSDCKNISNSVSAKVTLDLSGLSKKTLTVSNFRVSGLSDEYTSEITQTNISVTIIGPKSDIDSLSADKITAVIDTSNSKGVTGSVQMPVKFTFTGSNTCWAFGSYKANLAITEKQA